MTLHITADSIISDVQQQFHHLFPDFKLEFFFTPADHLNPSSHLMHSYPFVTIRELCAFNQKCYLDVKESMTVSQLEKKFRKKFGLPAMIYRKDGNYWFKKASIGKCTLGH
ncbi:MAG: hypothetical protein ACKVOW_15350 [Chitinophagaceae bacterium]